MAEGTVQVAGLPCTVVLWFARSVTIQVWLRGGRPVAVSCRVTTCPMPASAGMLVATICGMGLSTRTVLCTSGPQPAELQTVSVTSLSPGVEKVTVGEVAFDVPAQAATGARSAH